MKALFPPQILKSYQRGHEETTTFQRFTVLSPNIYQDKIRESLGQLYFFHDESLAPEQTATYTHTEDLCILLLPIAGSLDYIYKGGNTTINSEQVQIIELNKGETYSVRNPYPNTWINYLHIGLKSHLLTSSNQSFTQEIHLEEPNRLTPIPLKNISISIGFYNKRFDENYVLHNPDNAVFIYVINGVFDLQGRLLESRDGLILQHESEVEIEALVENSMVVLLEINLNPININNN